MKTKNKLKIVIILLILITIFIIFKNQRQENNQDDIIFFKLFSQGDQRANDKINDYGTNDEILFNMSNITEDSKEVNLLSTIKSDFGVEEKVAPGSNGKFFIKIITNKDIKYKVRFQSENEKPKNLMFNVEGSDKYYYNLEELEEELDGFVKKDTSEKLQINWKWSYEENEEENKQDTEDGMKIRQYNFKIYILVEE